MKLPGGEKKAVREEFRKKYNWESSGQDYLETEWE